MASLTLDAIPGFTDIPPENFDEGATASDVDMKAASDNAKYAAVRTEIFWGFYKNGETVALPVSSADGYEYGRDELVYMWSTYATEAATGACNGTQTAPPRGSTTGSGTMLQMEANIDQVTGVVYTRVAYYKTAQEDRNDGILKVAILATRNR